MKGQWKRDQITHERFSRTATLNSCHTDLASSAFRRRGGEVGCLARCVRGHRAGRRGHALRRGLGCGDRLWPRGPGRVAAALLEPCCTRDALEVLAGAAAGVRVVGLGLCGAHCEEEEEARRTCGTEPGYMSNVRFSLHRHA